MVAGVAVETSARDSTEQTEWWLSDRHLRQGIKLGRIFFYKKRGRIKELGIMALNQQQGKDLTTLLEAMGIEPEGENPEQLEQWVKTHLTAAKVQRADLETGATEGLAHQQVKLSVTFAGDETAKGGCRYDLWKYEVECLVKDGAHREEVIRQAIRRSLKGEAAHVLKRLGPQATVTQILQKFDGVYGVVEAGEDTLAEFYSARQEKGEDVSAWGCRFRGAARPSDECGGRGQERHGRDAAQALLDGAAPKVKRSVPPQIRHYCGFRQVESSGALNRPRI